MVPPAITTQPLPTSENLRKDVDTVINSSSENLKENITGLDQDKSKEVTTVLNEASHIEEMTEEEIEKRRERRTEDADCCCVYSPCYSDDTDAFCVYILCQWMCDCFRGIGECTESCFEGCANCIGECCEGDGCCDCDGEDVAGDGCADCFSGCADCCNACDCSS